MRRALFISICLASLGSGPVAAQFVQYVPPGTLADQTESAAESAKESSESARWKLGRIALDPRVEIRNLGYYENVFASSDESSAVDDVRGTIGAGLAGYVNLGAKSLVSAYVVPEYSWWQDQDALSGVNTSWAAGWFGFFNNLTSTANVRVKNQEQPLSDEIDVPVRIEEERQELHAELTLTDAFGLLASAISTEIRHGTDVEPFIPGLMTSNLDRDEETFSASMTLRLRDWRFGVGLQNSEVDLVADPELRSNSGESPFVEVRYQSEQTELEFTGIDREVEFASPDLARQKFTAGSARLRLRLSPTASLNLYGARSLALSALDSDSFIVRDRLGALMTAEVGRRFELTVLAEMGESEYREPGVSDRRDDLEVFGGELLWRVRPEFGLRLHLRDSTWDSNLAEFDRSQQSFGIDLVMGTGLFPW